MPPSSTSAPVHRIAQFYDRVYRLYPLIEAFLAPSRRRLIEHINRAPPGRLLEVGVGPGRHLRHYVGHDLTAVDCSAQMVALSRHHFPDTPTLLMDGEALGFPAASFDYVAACYVLSVTPDPARMLAEIHRVLRPGGRLFVLNHETPRHTWRHVERLLLPVSHRLRFRSWFRLREIPGISRFRCTPLAIGRSLGLMKAYSLQK